MPMTPTIKLCPTCAAIFLVSEGAESITYDSDEFDYHDHHKTFESLREAVELRCFICTKAWAHFGEDTHREWLSDKRSWTPLTYNLAVQETVIFSIRWSSSYLAYTVPARFHLVEISDPDFATSSEPDLETNTSSTFSLGQAYQWYMSCRTIHGQCCRLKSSSRWCPTRLVDVGVTGESVWKLRTSSELHTMPPYMTLSYTWGSTSFFKLTTSNIETCKRGNLVSDLPLTFRDMVDVAHRFSIRYVWIDSLCILQDSHEDWEREASSMSNVYTNSICNIAAAASADPHGGLFRSRNARDIQYGLIWSNAVVPDGSYYHILDEGYWGRQVASAVLHNRGWVLQERLLAPRTLHFADYQIFWECFLEQKCEAFPSRFPKLFRLSNPKIEIPYKNDARWLQIKENLGFQAWKEIVMLYSRCKLTVSTDKLIAVSGLAKLYQQASGDEYVAGLWRSCMAELLSWYVQRQTSTIRPPYRAPSWSWAAVDGPIDYLQYTKHQKFRVIDVQIEQSTEDSTGQVRGAAIYLQAIVVPVVCSRHGKRYTACDLSMGSHEFRSAELYEDVYGEASGNNVHLEFLVLGHSERRVHDGEWTKLIYVQGILLRSIPSVISDTYTRIGFLEFTDPEIMGYCGICVDPKSMQVTYNETDSKLVRII